MAGRRRYSEKAEGLMKGMAAVDTLVREELAALLNSPFDDKEKWIEFITQTHLQSYVSTLSSSDQRLVQSSAPDTEFEHLLCPPSSELSSHPKHCLVQALSSRLELLLTRGGDDRMLLDTDSRGRVNKYACSTIPDTRVLARGSCTSSSLSERLYVQLDEARLEMLKHTLTSEQDVLERHNTAIREEISSLLSVSGDVVLFPSGSDAEYLPSLVGVLRAGQLKAGKVVNFVVAAGEVGSGTASAAGGRYFLGVVPSAEMVQVEEPLEGFPRGAIEVVQFKPRDQQGHVFEDEDRIVSEVRGRLSDCETVCVLHLVAGSKTGLVYPSIEAVKTLAEEFGDRLIVVVDACQLRCELSVLDSYATLGFVLLVTGSKFYCGVPFCGAVVLPQCMSREIEDHISAGGEAMPAGLKNFLTSRDPPASMPHLKSWLGRDSSWMNPGLTLRWKSALLTMREFSRLSKSEVASFIKKWTEAVSEHVACSSPYLSLLQEASTASDVFPSNNHGIVSVYVSLPCGKMGLAELKKLHADMNSGEAPRVLLGQPVAVSSNTAVIRIALGADMVLQALAKSSSKPFVSKYDRIQNIIAQDEDIVNKMVSLVRPLWRDAAPESILYSVGHYKALAEKKRQLDKFFECDDSSRQLSTSTSRERLSATLKQIMSCKSEQPVSSAVLFDLEAIDGNCAAAKAAFPNVLHCFAIKSCPVAYIVQRVVKNGMGLETASIMEVRQAMCCGCAPFKIVFDSPCKTVGELVEALKYGVMINLNSFNELSKLKEAFEILKQQNITSSSVIGLRINPLVGAGKLSALSTATVGGKFGVLLNEETRESIIEQCVQHPFVTMLMCHVGSQGMALESMALGAARVCALAEEVDARCGERRIQVLDIGGGLSANYDTDESSPSFAQYAEELSKQCPALFTSNRLIITEFGKAIICKTAGIVALIEDVLQIADDKEPSTLICHSGADLLLRTAYVPASFTHRVELLHAEGDVFSDDCERTATNIAGPLCFSGDYLAKNCALPRAKPGDYVLVRDAGANTISLFSRHCSRQAPPVFLFSGAEDGLTVKCVKAAETAEQLLNFWF